ncbi:RagB/SusD family nutrient uptake outer membrane protein [Mucilaginibacter sp. OK098]|uniref:RagB/SusD family nutrient uptake outer membrane protein n=1 Tax=Mucilaginibacter sp. OK098 TaxID=1855297 RepID=UPI00090F72DB|nr:RagB/SusD family nutrient uptake outer membrane protein [Mucilaginibacter sp. OK098]SHL96442.1 Starch-binding associating with outer membrane [Mucilaginibacter sp. OK098]
MNIYYYSPLYRKFSNQWGIFICITMLCLSTGCKKFIEVPAPTTSTNTDIVFSDDAQAISVMTGLLAQISESNTNTNGGIASASIITDLSADNLNLSTSAFGSYDGYAQYYQNKINSQYSSIQGIQSFWQKIYPMIYTVNSTINGLNKSDKITPAVKQRLLGEAYFLRSFFYFYLVNFYGDVPLVLDIDYKVNSTIARSSSSDIYNQILSDLNQSLQLMDDRYVNSDVVTTTTERVRPNKETVNALLARTQLYLKHYAEADAAATHVINQTTSYSTNIPLNTVFLKNSQETIWSLQSVNSFYNTYEGEIFKLPSAGPASAHPFYVSVSLYHSFESGDLRKVTWIDSVTVGTQVFPFASKYKALLGNYNAATLTEYLIVFRLAEQYLIRAEARNEQGNLNGAKSDLNTIRNRAGLANTTAITQSELRSAILRERRTELFTEWGHRWLDLKRSGTIDAAMQIATPLKGGGAWDPTKGLYPVPLSDIKVNENLTQNPGY